MLWEKIFFWFGQNWDLAGKDLYTCSKSNLFQSFRNDWVCIYIVLKHNSLLKQGRNDRNQLTVLKPVSSVKMCNRYFEEIK